MYAFVVLVALALSLSVLLGALREIVPFRVPDALARTFAVVIAAGLAWLLGYSVFAAFGQELRAEWMHPVMTGLALVAVATFVRSLVDAIARGRTEPTDADPISRPVRAA